MATNFLVREPSQRTAHRVRSALGAFFSDYGMLAVLLALVVYYSVVTLEDQQPVGNTAGRIVYSDIASRFEEGSRIVIVAREGADDRAFVAALEEDLALHRYPVVARVSGDPASVRRTLEELAASGEHVDVIATTTSFSGVVGNIAQSISGLGAAAVVSPERYRWPTFLRTDNLINVANQIVVIAIMAIGMTMVIITGGIDLSVGSLVAFAAVAAGTLIAEMGGTSAATGAMIVASLLAILLCGAVGLFSGVMITAFRMPPFIATLGVMQVASGLAYIISSGASVYQIPDSFVWLGRGAALFSIPNAVILMVFLYLAAHLLMSRTTLGRYIYAVGGNQEAARLSGVRVKGVLLFVYTISGISAGLGGVILASQLKSGAPTYGLMYELYVIAAAVVGGTSLSGGQGKVMGTLIGALIIGVIQNGMNLTGVESYAQKVVLGMVILGAVLLDMIRRKN